MESNLISIFLFPKLGIDSNYNEGSILNLGCNFVYLSERLTSLSESDINATKLLAPNVKEPRGDDNPSDM